MIIGKGKFATSVGVDTIVKLFLIVAIAWLSVFWFKHQESKCLAKPCDREGMQRVYVSGNAKCFCASNVEP